MRTLSRGAFRLSAISASVDIRQMRLRTRRSAMIGGGLVTAGVCVPQEFVLASPSDLPLTRFFSKPRTAGARNGARCPQISADLHVVRSHEFRLKPSLT